MKEGLLKLLFGKETNKDRIVYLDVLRVIATLFVIGVHTTSLASAKLLERFVSSPESSAGMFSFYATEIASFLFISCNLLFIMQSGALLLPVKGERLRDFYWKRVSKILLPLVVYYFLYVCAKEGISWVYPWNWPKLLLRILIGPPEEAPHFWLMYVILGLYLITPFFRILLEKLSDTVLAGVMFVFLCICGIYTYFPNTWIHQPLSYFVDTFTVVFFMGYFLTREHPPWFTSLILVLGGCSVIFTIYAIIALPDYASYIYNNSPTMIFYSSGIFLLVKKICRNWTKEGYFLRLISKYSFSILLIHWGVLHFLVKQRFGVDVLSGGVFGGCLLMFVLTFLFSTLGAILIDLTLMNGIRFCFKKLGMVMHRNKKTT